MSMEFITNKFGIFDALYFVGSIMIDFGAIAQLVKIYSTKSAEDLSVLYVGMLLIGQLMLLPRSIKSKIFVWILCNVMCSILIILLLIGVILYR